MGCPRIINWEFDLRNQVYRRIIWVRFGIFDRKEIIERREKKIIEKWRNSLKEARTKIIIKNSKERGWVTRKCKYSGAIKWRWNSKLSTIRINDLKNWLTKRSLSWSWIKKWAKSIKWEIKLKLGHRPTHIIIELIHPWINQ